jgi:hypothetical protein
LYIFRPFCRKVAKGVQGPDPEPEKDTKMGPQGWPNGAQGSQS